MSEPTTKQATAFTGRQRQRKTTFAVKFSNGLARTLITTGGIMTVVAVTVVCVFLISVVIPLFLPPTFEIRAEVTAPLTSDAPPLNLSIDDYQIMGWTMAADGMVYLIDLERNTVLDTYSPFGDLQPTALAFSIPAGKVVAGFADGAIIYGDINYAISFLQANEVPEDVRDAAELGAVPFRNGLVQLTPQGQYRLQTLRIAMEQPATVESGVPIRLADISFKPSGPVIAALSESGHLHILEVSKTRNIMTGVVRIQLYGGNLHLPLVTERGLPGWLRLTGQGDNAYLVWQDGTLTRIDARNAEQMAVVEEVDLTPERDAPITATGFLLGKTSLVTGDGAGRVRVWFRIKPDHAETSDGTLLVMGHELPPAAAAVTTLTPSTRSRKLAVGDADGDVDLYYVTNNRRLVHITEPQVTGGVLALAIAPKDNAIYALGKDSMVSWDIYAPHAETTFKALFGKVWYEGNPEPEHVWQSAGGTDDFEPKLSLRPLIFGTIKATVYSMIFAVPLALLAAVYTSEVMQPRLRAKIKPTIEMMASLPSVVLGFLAALVIAPYVEGFVPALLVAFASIPFALLLGAYTTQLLPHRWQPVLRRQRPLAMLAALAIGIYLASLVGPWAERLFFGGDIKLWLAGRDGSGAGGWMIILLPAVAVSTAMANTRWVQPVLRRASRTWSRQRFVVFELVRFLAGAVVVYLVAWLLAVVMANGFGWDPRGAIVDTYVQRNALIVGFIMGFAVIPIIYTLTEDALSSVPEQLRAASLGTGATPWQTATRIIVPTAASGIFSAIMIGLGRAVGETMIVLMAAGNTPVMEWSMFNGFRTLSANIAVELPEAVKDSTHYRVLFLAALTLFAMTFVLNSVAEVIRQRVRKRAYQL